MHTLHAAWQVSGSSRPWRSNRSLRHALGCANPRRSALKWLQCGERGTSHQTVTRPSAAVPDWRAARHTDADDSEDEEEWDEADLEEEGDLTEPEIFGPPALVLAGFYLEELAGVRAMLDRAGGQGITVISCTPQLLSTPLGQALQQPEPRWEEAMPPNWVHGGGWGMQRMVVFSGLGLRAQGMVLQLLASSQMGDVVPLVATPGSAGRLLGQVLAEAFQAYRKRGPTGVDLPGGGQRRFVDSLPAVEEVVPREELAAAARGQQTQQQAAQAAQSTERNTEQGMAAGPGTDAGTAGGEAREQAHQKEQEESNFDFDFDFSSGGPPPLPPEGVEPRSLEDLLAELGGAGGWEVEAGGSDSDDDGQEEGGPSWQYGARQGDGMYVDADGQPATIDVEATIAAAVAGAAQRVAQGPAESGAPGAPSAGAPVLNSSPTASSSGSDRASSSSTTTATTTTGASANGAASKSSSSSSKSSSSSSSLNGITSRRTVIEADAVVPPPRQPEPASSTAAAAAAAAGAAGQQQSPGVDGWAMLAAEVLDVQPWTVPQPGSEAASKPRQQQQQHARQEEQQQQQQQQQQRLQQGQSSHEVLVQREVELFVGSSRGRRGVREPPAEAQGEVGVYRDDLDLDALDLIDRLVAKADRDQPRGGNRDATAPAQQQQQQQQQRQQRWARESAATPSIQPAGPSAGSPSGPAPPQPAPLTPGQVFPFRTRQQQPTRQQQQQGQQEQQQQQWQQPRQQQPRRPQQGGADSALLEGTPLLQRQTPRMRRRAGGLPKPGGVGPASVAGAGRVASNGSVISTMSNSSGAGASSSNRSGGSSDAPADVAGTSVGATARALVFGGSTQSLAANQSPLAVPLAEAQEHAFQQHYAEHAEHDQEDKEGQVEEGAGSLLQDQEEGGHSEEGVRQYTSSVTRGLSADAGGGAVAGARPMTKAELREVAAKHGLSFEQLLADAQARGIELPD